MFELLLKNSILSTPGVKNKYEKLNIFKKSKLDRTRYIDEKKIQNELKRAKNAKNKYLDKIDFLDKIGVKKENDISSFKKK